MRGSKFIQRWLVPILLLIFSGVSFYLRVVPAYDGVFASNIVKFNANDAYYFLRQIDSFVRNFPHLFPVDPYLNYPNGFLLGPMNFFVYLLGSITWLIGLGSPSEHMLDIISAYFPAVLGMLTVVPIYFIGKTLFNRRIGIISAALIAILPGELMSRTTLGATDRDALEILLITSTFLFLILAIKSARQKQSAFQHIDTWNLPVVAGPIIYSLLAGILLGLCLLTWRGTFLFVLVILVYTILQSIIEHLRLKSFYYLSFVGILTFLAALLIFGVVSRSQLYSVVLAMALILLLVLSGLAWVLARRNIKAFYYPLAIIGVGLLGLGIFYTVSPALFGSILNQLSVFAPTQNKLAIAEMKSILFPNGYFTIGVVWLNYTTGFFLSLISLCVISYFFYRREKTNSVILLLVVWSLIMLVATLYLRRFAPFFAINVALLTGYLAIILYYLFRFIINLVMSRSNEYVSSELMEFTGFKTSMTVRPSGEHPKFDYYEAIGVPRNATHKRIKKAHRLLTSKYQTGGTLEDKDREKLRQIDQAFAVLSDSHKRAAYDRSYYGVATQKKGKLRRGRRGGFQIARWINVAVASLAIFFLVFFPNFKPARITVDETISFAPSDEWYNSLSWLKNNTPDPFGDAAFYSGTYQVPFDYPETAYGVAAWWDYGYWILRIGHRIPSCDPGGGDRETVARLFTAQNEVTANELTSNLNSKYIILDDATVTTKFYAVATYAGTSSDQFSDVYYRPMLNTLVPFFYYYPDFYKSLAVRLYYFDGEAITPSSTSVISYEEKVSQEGVSYKEIVDTQDFSTFEEASAYIAKQTSGNYRIASPDPSVSPVPLDSLEQYMLVYSSSQSTPPIQGIPGSTSSVKIFEHIK